MLKTLLGRRGKEAQTFFAMCGARLPDTESTGYSYTFVNEGCVVNYAGVLPKGSSMLSLPPPELGPNVILLVTPHGSLLDEAAKVEVPVGVFGREALTHAGIEMRVAVKDNVEYNGPVAIYYLLGSH